MKNKNLLYCFATMETSVKAKRLVYQEKGPDKQPETSRQPENDMEIQKEAYRKETMRSAKWVVKYIEKNFPESSDMAGFAHWVIETIKMVEDTERSKSALLEADKLEDVYKLLRDALESARTGIQGREETEKEWKKESENKIKKMKEKEDINEAIKLHGRAVRKLMDAVNHFESEVVKEKTGESLLKVAHDYMDAWWSTELNEHEREILCRPRFTSDGKRIGDTAQLPVTISLYVRGANINLSVAFLGIDKNAPGPKISARTVEYKTPKDVSYGE